MRTLPYNPNWSRTSTSTGYEVTHCPDHPRAWKTGYIYTHILIAEKTLGRLLNKGEVVHHINHNRFDNDPKNLKVTTQSKHFKEHKRITFAKVLCPHCGKIFERRKNQTHLIKGGAVTTCSPHCRASLNAKKQHNILTKEMKERLKTNILGIYTVPVSQLDRESDS